jgi:hypothetical protein
MGKKNRRQKITMTQIAVSKKKDSSKKTIVKVVTAHIVQSGGRHYLRDL